MTVAKHERRQEKLRKAVRVETRSGDGGQDAQHGDLKFLDVQKIFRKD